MNILWYAGQEQSRDAGHHQTQHQGSWLDMRVSRPRAHSAHRMRARNLLASSVSLQQPDTSHTVRIHQGRRSMLAYPSFSPAHSTCAQPDKDELLLRKDRLQRTPKDCKTKQDCAGCS